MKLSIDQTLLKAKSHIRKGEVDAARTLYQAVLERFPKNKRASHGLAALAEARPSKGDRDEALGAHLKRLTEQLKSGDAEPVAREAVELLKTHDDNVRLWDMYGIAHMKMGHQQEAQRAFEQAIKIAPNSVNSLINLAAVSEEMGELDVAAQYFQRALSIAPNLPSLMARMGDVLRKQGELSAAQEWFEQVLTSDPNHILTLSALGSLHHLRGDFTKAVACYERILTILPHNIQALKYISNVPVGQLSADRVQQLQEVLEQIDVADADRINWMFAQGNLYRHKGDMHKALDRYCAANAAKLQTLSDDIKFRVNEQKMQLNRLRHWTPQPTAKTARVQTLVILGPSRAGKTTLETMLQNSPYVASAYEAWRTGGKLARIEHLDMLRAAKGADTIDGQPNLLTPLGMEDVFYKNEGALIAKDKHVLTATSPAFVRYAAHLADLLPGVYFCYIKRDPAEIAGQIFSKNYTSGNSHSYDPTALLAYLDWHAEMWDVLSGKVRGITVNFEDIVGHPQQAVEKIEEMLGLNLQIRDLTPAGFNTVDPFAAVFADRFMTQSR